MYVRRAAAVAALLTVVTACTPPGRDAAPSRTPRPGRTTASGPDRLELLPDPDRTTAPPTRYQRHRIPVTATTVRWPVALRIPYGRALTTPPEEGDDTEEYGTPSLVVTRDGIWVLDPEGRRAVRFDQGGRVTGTVPGLHVDDAIVAFPGGFLVYGERRVLRVENGRVTGRSDQGIGLNVERVSAGVGGAVATFADRYHVAYLPPLRTVDGAPGIPGDNGDHVRFFDRGVDLAVGYGARWDATLEFVGTDGAPWTAEPADVHVTERSVHLWLDLTDFDDVATWYVRLGADGRLEASERMPLEAYPSRVVGPDDRPWLLTADERGVTLFRRP